MPRVTLNDLLVNTREIDHRYQMRRCDKLAVDACQRSDHIVLRAKLGIFSLDVPRREFGNRLALHAVQNGGIKLLPSPKAWADRDPNHHARFVLLSLVAQADGGRLPMVPKDVLIEVIVEVERKHEGCVLGL